MDMRSPDRPFEHGPEGFERVDVGISVRPILGAIALRAHPNWPGLLGEE